MAKLILKMIISLDGLVAVPDGSTDWMAGHEGDAEVEAEVRILRDTQLHLMGSRTFNDMHAYWPQATGPIAAAMNEIPKGVFSRRGLAAAGTTPSLGEMIAHRDQDGDKADAPAGVDSWAHPEIFTGDLAEGLRALRKREGRPILIHGGASFARAAVATGEIDEYCFFAYPVVLGAGEGVFDGGAGPIRLKAVDFTRFDTGSTLTVYRPD